MEKLALLKEFKLFDKLSEQELEKIASGLKEKIYADGDVICQRGAPGGSLYLIKRGTAIVVLSLTRYAYEKKYDVVANLREGMFFGELSFFDGKEYSADVYAKGKVNLLELKKADFDNIIAANPESGYDIQNKIILNLVSNIREMNKRYSLNALMR